jgi:serine/threonine protein kinase
LGAIAGLHQAGLRIQARAVDVWGARDNFLSRGDIPWRSKKKEMKGFPRRFGPYALAKPLARGGMGALYLAVRDDARESGVCVIKTVLPHLADREYLQRFRDEGKVVVQLSHENLVPVFDSGQIGGEIYLGMNFVDGKDLRAVWNRCAKKGVAFPMDVAVFIVRELARGLTYAHGFGDIKLVHRDISPPNVLVGYDGSVKLTDFGLASSTLKLEKTAPGIIYGKVSYMSPEQARGEPLDGRTDQFAAGIILWELLTGRQLYPAKTGPVGPGAAGKEVGGAEELLKVVRNPTITAPSKRASRVPPELDRIALKALAPKGADRYASCAAFADDLGAYLRTASPSTNRERVSKFLSDLYAEDIAAEKTERETVLAEARALLGKPREKGDRGLKADEPVSSLTMPVAAIRPPKAAAEAPAALTKRPPPTPGANRSGHETVVGGPIDHARARHLANRTAHEQVDEVSAAFAESAASSSHPAGGTSTVVGSLVGGRYQVRRLRGEGGMGRVYEAEHVEIGKRVALKILHPGYSQTPDLVERLRREARAASRIGHPNVVDVTDSGTTDDGAFFFVMEYLEGRELGEIIFEEKGLDLRRAITISTQICRALSAAHKAGVIHRDLKPENVLLVERDGQPDFVKVLDFGIAKNLTEPDTDDEKADQKRRKLTNPGVAMGTPEYMAPEQAAGKPADVRSDVYAVGGILYEMLSGRAAYEGSNFMEILHKKATEPPPSLGGMRNDIPPEMEDLVRRTMAKDPAARPQSMEEMERELNEIAWHCLPSEMDERNPMLVDTPRPVVLNGSRYGNVAVWERLLGDRRRVAMVGGAAFLVLALAVVGISRSGATSERGTATVPTATMGPGPGAPAANPAPRPATLPTAPAVAAPATEVPEERPPGDVEVAAKDDKSAIDEAGEGKGDEKSVEAPTIKARTVATGPAAAEAKKMLAEAEGLLRAQRFAEARTIYTRLTKVKSVRGRALVALAEIAFQEKNYEETIRSAKLAAERGGGARARVLLGDAHFRLSHFQDAAAAYGQALRLDPGNTSARSGLALASKRM